VDTSLITFNVIKHVTCKLIVSSLLSDVCVNLKLGLFVIFWSIIIKQLLRYFDRFDDGATLIEVLIVFVLFIKTKKL